MDCSDGVEALGHFAVFGSLEYLRTTVLILSVVFGLLSPVLLMLQARLVVVQIPRST